MGKEKQRTKGNARPSNSARAAEQLGGAGGAFAFSGVNPFLAAAAAATGESATGEDDFAVDPALRMALAKLAKKDATTKLKALQDILELFNTLDPAVVAACLPHWPRAYGRLCADGDWRVREATQNALGALITRVGKASAPHLRAIVPAWIAAQHDTSREVAGAAQRAFAAAFPQSARRAGVVAHCRDEIVRHLSDAASSAREAPAQGEDPRDTDERHERAVASALGGFSFVVEIVADTEHAQAVHAAVADIASNAKMWKASSTHASPLVRSSLLSLAAALARRMPGAVRDNARAVLPAVFSLLGDKSFLTHAAMWDAVGAGLDAAPEALTASAGIVSWRKAVFPKLWAFLRSACYGSGATSYASLAAFVPHIPRDVTGDGVAFSTELFTSLWTGAVSEHARGPEALVALCRAHVALTRFFLFDFPSVPSPDVVDVRPHAARETIGRACAAAISLPRAGERRTFPHADFFHGIADVAVSFTRGSADCADDLRGVGAVRSLWDELEQAVTATVRAVAPAEAPVPEGSSAVAEEGTQEAPAATAGDAAPKEGAAEVAKNAPDGGAANKKKAAPPDPLHAPAVPLSPAVAERVSALFDALSAASAGERSVQARVSAMGHRVAIACVAEAKVEGDESQTPRRAALLSLAVSLVSLFGGEGLSSTDAVTWMLALARAGRKELASATGGLVAALVRGGEDTEWTAALSSLQECPEALAVVLDNLARGRPLSAWFAGSLDALTSTSAPSVALWDALRAAVGVSVSREGGSESALSAPALDALLRRVSATAADPLATVEDVAGAAAVARAVFLSEVAVRGAGERRALVLDALASCGVAASRIEEEGSVANMAYVAGCEALARVAGGVDAEVASRVCERIAAFSRTSASADQLAASARVLLHPAMAQLAGGAGRVVAICVAGASDWSESFATAGSVRLCSEWVRGALPVPDAPLWEEDGGSCNGERLGRLAAFASTLLSRAGLAAVLASGDHASRADCSRALVFTARALCWRRGVARTSGSWAFEVAERTLEPVLSAAEAAQTLSSEDALGELVSLALSDAADDSHSVAVADVLRPSVAQWPEEAAKGALKRFVSVSRDPADRAPAVGAMCAGLFAQRLPARVLSPLAADVVDLALDGDRRGALVCVSACDLIDALAANGEGADAAALAGRIVDRLRAWGASRKEEQLPACFDTALARAFSSLVESSGGRVYTQRLEFVGATLLRWLRAVEQQGGSLQGRARALIAFAGRVMSLLVAHQQNLPFESREWKAFADPAWDAVLSHFLADAYAACMRSNPSASASVAVEYLANATAGCSDALLATRRASFLRACQLLMARSAAVQRAAHGLVTRIATHEIKALAADEGDARKATEGDAGSAARAPPRPLLDNLAAWEADATNRHAQFGAMLTWLVVLGYIRGASPALRSEYLTALRDIGAVDRMLSLVASHLPLSQYAGGPAPSSSAAGSFSAGTDAVPAPDAEQCLRDGSPKRPAPLAALLYYRALRDVPAAVRAWWATCDRQQAAAVERYTARRVSPPLILGEIRAVQAQSQAPGPAGASSTMKVRASVATAEVVATYTVDEISVELVVQLPASYPLRSPEVTSGARVGANEAQWRKWLLQLTVFLSSQNGSIAEGLSLWRQNVDKRFEGVEECTICYAVINATNYQLPQLRCKTCKNKFHSACLYKWFSTSGNATCPLCRNIF